MSRPEPVLAFMAHPDDIEFLCAGALSRLKERDHPIHLASMTAGDCGSAEFPAQEISRIRLNEARESAQLISATYHCGYQKDFLISLTDDTLRRAVEILRLTQAGIVITHYPSDYMIDHEVTSQIVRHATFVAGAPNFETDEDLPILQRIPHLYYASPVEGKDIFGQSVEMDFYVDVTPAIEIKVRMLECHESQREWLKRQHGMDEYVEMMLRWSREAGQKIGVDYAEGFRQHRGHAYPQENRLLELLDE